MLSHVLEFNCQYSADVRKKHKIWHDGKLRYYQLNNKFTLHTLDNTTLSSKFVTNQRDVACYLDEENFDLLEHRIFGSFIVIISDLIREYDKEIQNVKTNSSISLTSNTPTTHTKLPEVKPQLPKKKPILKTELKPMEKKGNGMSVSGLVLKFNKPFKPPKRLDPPAIKSVANRPNVRNSSVLKQQLVQMPDSTEDNNISMNISDDMFPSTQHSFSEGLLNFSPPKDKLVSATTNNQPVASTPAHVNDKKNDFNTDNYDFDTEVNSDGKDKKGSTNQALKFFTDTNKETEQQVSNQNIFRKPFKTTFFKLKERPGFKIRKIIHSPLIIPQ